MSLKRKSSINCSSGQEIGGILSCLQQKEKKKIFSKIPQQNQQLIKQLNYQTSSIKIKGVLQKNCKENPELLEQLLQAANMARNTLALRLLQQDIQQKIHTSSQQIINNNYYSKEQQCQFI